MSDAYNAASTRDIRAATKAAKALDAERKVLIYGIMSSPAGRSYIHDCLARCHVFAPSFTPDPYVTAFREGERNEGLRCLNDLMRYCPDLYISMMREQNDKEQSNGGRTNGVIGESRGSGEDTGGADSGRIESEYDPADGDTEPQS